MKQCFHHHSQWLMIMIQKSLLYVFMALCLTFSAFILVPNKVMCLSIIILPLEKGLTSPLTFRKTAHSNLPSLNNFQKSALIQCWDYLTHSAIWHCCIKKWICMLINWLQSNFLKLDKINNLDISVIYDKEAQRFLFVFPWGITGVEWEAFLYYVHRFHYSNLSILYIHIESICSQN